MPSALISKTATTKMDKIKLNIAIEVLQEVYVEFLETKEFIDKKLEQKCSKENISMGKLAQQNFLMHSVRF